MSKLMKHSLVMLPTNQKADLGVENWYLLNAKKLVIDGFIANIYILSDDEFEHGDWVYNTQTNHVYPITLERGGTLDRAKQIHKKIIATTDVNVTVRVKLYMIDNPTKEDETFNLPELSFKFIQKYISELNNGNSISEVMVEYTDDVYANGKVIVKSKLKVNLNDNTITVRKVKQSWNKSEVENLLRKLYYESTGKSTGHPDSYVQKFIDNEL